MWLIAAGDMVLFASTQFPESERPAWEDVFARVLGSLEVFQSEDPVALALKRKLLARLREQFPAEDFQIEGEYIRSGGLTVFPGNLLRRVLRHPEDEEALIDEFVTGLSFAGDDAPSAENLGAVRDLIIPVLKPREYVQPRGPTRTIVHRVWLGGLLITYAIEGSKTIRFVLEKDLERWGLDADELHAIAIENLSREWWPEFPQRRPRSAPLILVTSAAGSDSRRNLDPRLHKLFAPVLGKVFLAGVPERDTLVLFPIAGADLKGAARAVREDHDQALNPLTTVLFKVTSRGVEEAKLYGL
jgi:hypothetical protein